MTEYIKAPFNFVPVSDKVFIPEWAEQVSQDVPFSDALSGTIHLKIIAKTPMFIRNGHTESDHEANNSEWKSFSNESGKYFIPATSIKGEVRTILEIMSFSKMRLDESAQFAQREWDNSQLYTIKSIGEQAKIHCGWLRPNGNSGSYEITDCGKPCRISQKRIDEYLGSHILEDTFSDSARTDLNRLIGGYDPKTAAFKYHIVEQAGMPLEDLTFSADGDNRKNPLAKRVRVNRNGKIKGTIVLTGQPSKWVWPRRKNGGKFWEFVFQDQDTPKKYQVSEEEFMHFRFIYRDSPEWREYSMKLSAEGKGLPVFFRPDGDKIKDFGMAYLYKLPYEKTPFESLPPQHQDKTRHDLAECIFGYISKDKSLRGRVHFGSAFSSNARPDKDVRLVLNSPKASYYPLYIRQKGKNGKVPEHKDRRGKPVMEYATYNDSTISGWKRYHVRIQPWTGPETSAENENLNTVIYPVKPGAVFRSDITFFNLRPVELGALLSALTFHNTPGCYHQLGQGKPYGYGKSTYEVTLDADHAASAGYYMALFEQAMQKVDSGWLGSEQVASLITMSHEEIDNSEGFNYMHMENGRDNNQFIKAKLRGEYLQPVAERLHKLIPAATLADELKPERREELSSLVSGVLGHLAELGGDPDAQILTRLQKYSTDAGAALTISSLRAKCDANRIKRDEAEAQKRREIEEAKIKEQREREEAEARKKRELEEAEAQRNENNRAIIKAGLSVFMGASPLAYGQWCGKVKKWISLITKCEGRTALNKEEQNASLKPLKGIFSNAKTRKAIKYKEVSKLIGRTVTEDTLKNLKA